MAVWLVTGAGRGLGKEIALAAARDGHDVAAAVRDPATISEELRGRDDIMVVPMDVTDPGEVQQAVRAVLERFDTIDVLVNNAGRGLLGAIESTTEQEISSLYELNVFSLIRVTRAVLPVMRVNDRGRVINIGSMGGVAAFAGTGVYASTKFAVEGLSEAMHSELRETGIRVTVVEPGSLRTDFMDSSSMTVSQGQRFPQYDATVDSMVETHLATNGRQPGDPAKAAAAVLRLAEHPNPPTWLLLGEDAVTRAEDKIVRLAQAREAWREVSLSIGFSD
jgi:NAD(P)-dependent dehydrogenase (short-subunit alcohol dehydrogenase family)